MTEYNKIVYPAYQAAGDPYRAAARTALLKALAYFDIFQYPLTRTELQIFVSVKIPASIAEIILAELVTEKRVYQLDEYYSLQDNPLLVYRRRQGNERAVALLQKAERIGRFLYQFPFVKAIGISGSLSKNFADQQADIDFFIITASNRLWIARTLMHLYKKLMFITGRQHYYCMNYYIDEQAYALEDRNIFTAIELKTLLPVCGEKTMQHFFTANGWAENWLPLCNWRKQARKEPPSSFFKKFGEWLFPGKIGNRINEHLWCITDRRWKKKEEKRKLNGKGVPMGLITGIHSAKSNAGDFQEKILALYEKKVIQFDSSMR
jgi:predicted nucleotidyltransferase